MGTAYLYGYKEASSQNGLLNGAEDSVSKTGSASNELQRTYSMWMDTSEIDNLDIKQINSVKLMFYAKATRKLTTTHFSYLQYRSKPSGQSEYRPNWTSTEHLPTSYNSSPYSFDLGTWTKEELIAGNNIHIYLRIYVTNGAWITQTTYIKDVKVEVNYTLNTYTVTFKDHDGTTLKTYTVDSGTKIGNGTSYTYPTPTNYQDNYYIYTNGRYQNVNTTVTANKTYYPTYDKTERKYQVNLTQSTGGTVTAQDTSGNQSQSSISVGYNQQVTLNAVANEGYKFKHWKDNPSNTSPNRIITVTTDGATYEAVFVPVVPKITSISWDIGADHLIAGTGVTTLTVTVEEVEE